jgi:hypothetical protein
MMSTHKVHESLVTDSLASKAGWFGLSQNSSDFKTEHDEDRSKEDKSKTPKLSPDGKASARNEAEE